MNYLLDTHVIIWHFMDENQLPAKIRNIMDNPDNNIFISSASLWEIVIKTAIGKLDISFGKLLNQLDNIDFVLMQIEPEYLKRLQNLLLIHKDPFDRLLIATAQAENLTIITTDENIHQYNVQWIW